MTWAIRVTHWALLTLASAAMLLATPSHAHHGASPTTEAAMRLALAQGHRDVFGRTAPRLRLLVALAQVSHETGRGAFVTCHNLGNVGALRSDPSCVTKGGFRVWRYASARASARAYWRLRAVRKSLPHFDRGDAAGAAVALRGWNYYTAPAADYAVGMGSLFREYSRRWAK